VRNRGRNEMSAKCTMLLGLPVLMLMVLLHVHCQRSDAGDNFGSADLYGNWKCYAVHTYWKSMPDSVRIDPVDSINNLYRITSDSILNYAKADSVPCYAKIFLAVEYTENPYGDTVSLNTNLTIQAFKNGDGVVLKYFYANVDSINEYYLRKIETPFLINVCDYGNMLFKTTECCGMSSMGKVSVAIQCMGNSSRNIVPWF
jgi:hypothetical protein